MPIYRFTETPLEPHCAHSGKGQVLAARVRQREKQSALNFIDLVDIPPGVEIGLHRHSAQDEEIYVVINGEAEMAIDGRTERVGAGDVIVNPPGSVHGLKNLGHQTIRLVVIDISTDGSAFTLPQDCS